MKLSETRTPEGRCPHCQHKLDACSSFEGAAPSPGDFSVCLECASPLVFKADLTVRAMSPDEFVALDLPAKRMLRLYMKIIRQIDRRATP